MIRAVFEGVAYNSRWLLRYVERFVGRRLDGIHMVGGGARSDVWCQIHADVLDRTVRQVQDPVQVNARGIALLAAVACGLITFEQIGDVAIANTYHPNPANRQIYDELFAAYETIYKQNRRLYAALNRESS
jgi:xylulokinase